MEPKFFETPEDFRKWLEKNHDKADELLVGYYKKDSGKPSITWPESVDEALCYGWIDGIRRSVDAESYTIRFTPRRKNSIWSAVNIKRVEVLTQEGRMKPAGLKAFEARDEKKSVIYSHEREQARLDDAAEKQFKANKKAWEFFQSQASSYRKAVIWWVLTAKQEATHVRRLAQLIEHSENERRLSQFTSPTPKYNKPKE